MYQKIPLAAPPTTTEPPITINTIHPTPSPGEEVVQFEPVQFPVWLLPVVLPPVEIVAMLPVVVVVSAVVVS